MTTEARCGIAVGRDRHYLRKEPRAGREPLGITRDREEQFVMLYEREGDWPCLTADLDILVDLREVR